MTDKRLQLTGQRFNHVVVHEPVPRVKSHVVPGKVPVRIDRPSTHFRRPQGGRNPTHYKVKPRPTTPWARPRPSHVPSTPKPLTPWLPSTAPVSSSAARGVTRWATRAVGIVGGIAFELLQLYMEQLAQDPANWRTSSITERWNQEDRAQMQEMNLAHMQNALELGMSYLAALRSVPCPMEPSHVLALEQAEQNAVFIARVADIATNGWRAGNDYLPDPNFPQAEPPTEVELGRIGEGLGLSPGATLEVGARPDFVEVTPSKTEVEIIEKLRDLPDEALEALCHSLNPIEAQIAKRLLEERAMEREIAAGREDERRKSNGEFPRIGRTPSQSVTGPAASTDRKIAPKEPQNSTAPSGGEKPEDGKGTPDSFKAGTPEEFKERLSNYNDQLRNFDSASGKMRRREELSLAETALLAREDLKVLDRERSEFVRRNYEYHHLISSTDGALRQHLDTHFNQVDVGSTVCFGEGAVFENSLAFIEFAQGQLQKAYKGEIEPGTQLEVTVNTAAGPVRATLRFYKSGESIGGVDVGSSGVGGRVVLELTFDHPIGHEGVIEVDGGGSKPVLVERTSGGRKESVQLVDGEKPQTNRIYIIGGAYGPTGNFGLFTVFPGRYSPPMTDTGYWNRHAFVTGDPLGTMKLGPDGRVTPADGSNLSRMLQDGRLRF